MKIKYIYTKDFGPLEDWHEDLTDDWTGETHDYVLISGPNGSGKSMLLRLIAALWEAVGLCLDGRKSTYVWSKYYTLVKRGAGAIILEELFADAPKQIGLFSGSQEYYTQLSRMHPDVVWIGVSYNDKNFSERGLNLTKPRIHLPDEPWIQKWRDARQRMLVSQDFSEAPNMLYLDAEARRWVAPRRRVGQFLSDQTEKRWLTTYEVSEDWEGQIENQLINIKLVDTEKFNDIVQDLNQFFIGKEIDPTMRPEDQNRLRIQFKNNPRRWHRLDELSSGERQVLIILFTVSRWLENGGIVLIDEPDLHLHPSLIASMLGALEKIVKKRNGQLIITSHTAEVWNRYETIGKRIVLGGQQ